jgi:hypothetical protein
LSMFLESLQELHLLLLHLYVNAKPNLTCIATTDSLRRDCLWRFMPTSTTLTLSIEILPHNDPTLPRKPQARKRTYFSLPQDVLTTPHQREREWHGISRHLLRLLDTAQRSRRDA